MLEWSDVQLHWEKYAVITRAFLSLRLWTVVLGDLGQTVAPHTLFSLLHNVDNDTDLLCKVCFLAPKWKSKEKI